MPRRESFAAAGTEARWRNRSAVESAPNLAIDNIDNIKNVFAIKGNGKVAMIGYLSTGSKNCKKLEYFSLGQNGKHYAKKENNTISYKLVWNSNSNQYVYYNFFKADGLDAINNCVYMITAK